MNYNQTLEALYSRNEFSIKLGLENIKKLLSLLNSPHKRFQSIHVAGTNGKGSVACYLAEILKAQGYKTGLYTSPHLNDFRERIRVNQKRIPKEEVLKGLQKIYKLIETGQAKEQTFVPTFFEIVTALAFDFFSNKKVDIAVVETGLGGRLDSTNVIGPAVSVITDIAMDHSEILGKTLPEIALEKAGIIKAGTPVVTSEKSNRILELFKKKAKSLNSAIYKVPSHIPRQDQSNTDEEIFDYNGDKWTFKNLKIKNLGEHQVKNAATALTVLEQLSNRKWVISEQAVRKGLLESKWEGRFQVWRRDPFVVLDGCHNSAAVDKMIQTLVEKRCRNPLMIFGAMRDKDLESILGKLGEMTDTFFLVSAGVGKAAPVSGLKEILRRNGFKGNITLFQNIPDALTEALKGKREICVCGSLYVVGEALAALKKGVSHEPILCGT